MYRTATVSDFVAVIVLRSDCIKTPSWIFNIAFIPWNNMNVGMPNGLPCGFIDIDSNIEIQNTEKNIRSKVGLPFTVTLTELMNVKVVSK
jgi:hypothetical protein